MTHQRLLESHEGDDMSKLVRLLLGIAVATALIGAATVTGPVAQPAAAATYVTTKWTAPHRGERSADVLALQRRLRQVHLLTGAQMTSYFGSATEAAVRAFQREYGLTATGRVSYATWKLLVKKSGQIKIVVPAVKGISKACKTSGRVLCINKTTRKLYYLKNSKIIKTMDARFGCAGMRTREGIFHVNWKSRNHVSTIYHTAMPYAMFFSGGQAVHYSSDFAARGYAGCSHGCVNIRDKSTIRWVFDQIRVGDRVVVYWS
jgi:lipoprotein-anchoring transpeptidase ErfK/SrfK